MKYIILLCIVFLTSNIDGKPVVEKEPPTLQKAKKIRIELTSVQGQLSDLIYFLRFRSDHLDKQAGKSGHKGLPIVTQQSALENMRIEISLRDKTVYEILEVVAKDLKIEVVYGNNAIVLRKHIDPVDDKPRRIKS